MRAELTSLQDLSVKAAYLQMKLMLLHRNANF